MSTRGRGDREGAGPPESKLDAGLQAAFGASKSGAQDLSVLETLARRTGRAPKVLLRDESSPDAASPVIDASARKDLPLTAGRGNYQLLGEIASGGMGSVMKAHDLDLGRDVALKILHEKLAADPTVLQRFVEEAQIGGQLQHPGIVPVYELGLMADDRPFFTMKLVKGRTLGALLKARKSPDVDRHRFLTIFEQICQTMAYAHSKGVIHRDLKSANVMVGAFGEVQVVDWGLAKVLGTSDHDDSQAAEGASQISIIETVRSTDTDGSASMAGSVMGTPAYMPPEQALGNVELLDERADVFALGALLAEILTGKPPYSGNRQVALTMAARANQTEVIERLEVCDAEAELVELCKNCMAADPSARPTHAGEVSERMRSQLASVEERAREAQVEAAEARVRATEERRRRRLTLTLAAAVLALVVGGGGGWVYLDQERTRAESGRMARVVRTESQVDEARSEARVAAAGLDWTGAIAHYERGLALARAGDGGEDLVPLVERELEQARSEARAIEAREELRLDNAALMIALEQLRRPWGTIGEVRNHGEEEAAFGETLWSFGIAPDLDDAETAAAKIRARGPEMVVELAAVLEEWARMRGNAQLDGAEALLHVADLVDPDPARVALREAIRRGDVASMRAATADEGLAELPIRTLALLGKALAGRNAYPEALAVYRSGIHRHPESFALHMGMQKVMISMRPRRFQEALEHLQAARALRPESPGVWAQMGWVLGSLDRLEEAITVGQRAIDLGAKWASVYSGLGSRLSNSGHYREALEHIERAIQLDPGDALAHNNLGITLRKMGRYGKAVESFRLAIRLDEEESSFHRNLGMTLCQMGLYGSADECFQRAADLEPGVAINHHNLGFTQVRMSHDEAAIESFQRAIKLDPGMANAHSNLAWLLATASSVALRDPLEAVHLARRASGLEATNGEYWGTLGTALYRAGETAEAVEQLEKAIRWREEQGQEPSVEDAFFICMALYERGAAGEARSWYDRGVEWIEAATAPDPNHARFRSEAAELLGIEEADYE